MRCSSLHSETNSKYIFINKLVVVALSYRLFVELVLFAKFSERHLQQNKQENRNDVSRRLSIIYTSSRHPFFSSPDSTNSKKESYEINSRQYKRFIDSYLKSSNFKVRKNVDSLPS